MPPLAAFAIRIVRPLGTGKNNPIDLGYSPSQQDSSEQVQIPLFFKTNWKFTDILEEA